MARDNISDLLAFFAVAREQSFTRAAGKLGVSQSALSHTIRLLETRLGVRLLIRTTRSVSPTEAGERLLHSVAPQLEAIEDELSAVGDLSGKAMGTVRIATTDYAANTILNPRLAPLLRNHPDLRIEMHVTDAPGEGVDRRHDLAVWWGDQFSRDMEAVRIGPDMRRVIVGSARYLAARPAPLTPQDLVHHSCIAVRTSSVDRHVWELSDGQRKLHVQIDGQVTFNGIYQTLTAALDDCGLAFVPEGLATPHVEAGQLRYVLEDWFPALPGLHLYYSKRRERSRAVALVVHTLSHE